MEGRIRAKKTAPPRKATRSGCFGFGSVAEDVGKQVVPRDRSRGGLFYGDAVARGHRPHTIDPLADQCWCDMDGLRQLAVSAQLRDGAFDGFGVHVAKRSIAILQTQ